MDTVHNCPSSLWCPRLLFRWRAGLVFLLLWSLWLCEWPIVLPDGFVSRLTGDALLGCVLAWFWGVYSSLSHLWLSVTLRLDINHNIKNSVPGVPSDCTVDPAEVSTSALEPITPLAQATKIGLLHNSFPNDDNMVSGSYVRSSIFGEFILLDVGVLFLDPLEPDYEDDGEEVEEEDFDPSEDDSEPMSDHDDDCMEQSVVDPFPPPIPEDTQFDLPPLFQNSEELFSDAEFQALMDNEQSFDQANHELSDSTFQSLHNSLLSFSFMVNQLGGLEMNQTTITHSNSSKRKSKDGDEDTASSILMGFKKTCI